MLNIDTADTVFHKPSRETWVVACVIGKELMWCGWPEGCANINDCLLVDKASKKKRRDLLLKLSKSDKGVRSQYAITRLHATVEVCSG